MYVQPKTDFIYIPKYTDTSSYDRAIESAKRTISKLDNALDEEIAARKLAGAARDHLSGIVTLRDNMINTLAHEYNIPEEKINKVKKEELIKLPEDIKKDMNPNVINRILNS